MWKVSPSRARQHHRRQHQQRELQPRGPGVGAGLNRGGQRYHRVSPAGPFRRDRRAFTSRARPDHRDAPPVEPEHRVAIVEIVGRVADVDHRAGKQREVALSCARVGMSRPAKGSSRISVRGAIAATAIRQTRCFCPCDSAEIGASAHRPCRTGPACRAPRLGRAFRPPELAEAERHFLENGREDDLVIGVLKQDPDLARAPPGDPW